MRILRDFVCVLILLGGCAGAFGAAPQGSFAFGDALRDGGWEAVVVKVDVPPGGGVLWVSDARGGLEIGRPVDGGEGREVLMSLPLLAAEGLRVPDGAAWSLRVRLAPSGAVTNLPESLALKVTRTGEGESKRALRIAVPAGRGPADLKTLRPLEPFALATISETEILAAPPLCLAGCDAVYVDDALAGKMSSGRAAEVMACGVRLIYAGTSVPGVLSEFTWATLPGSAVRVAPLEYASLTSPRVIEPTLVELKVHPPTPSGGLKATLLLLTPAVVLLVLLVRAFTARPGVIVGVLAVGLVGGSALTVARLKGGIEPSTEQLRWQTREAPGNLAMNETLTFRGALFDEPADMTSTNPVPLLPLASEPGHWLSGIEGRLLLDTQAAGPAGLARFYGSAQPRRTRAFISRGVTREYPLPANGGDPLWQAHLGDHHVDLARGFDIVDSHVRRADSREEPEVITAWLGHQAPPIRRQLDAWYQLRFDPRQRYHLELAGAGLLVVDFGAVAEER